MTGKICSLALITGLFGAPVLAANSPDFYQQRLDVQLRYDNRSDRSDRSQYRVRFYPQFNLSSQWSLHSFIVTGDDFASSHNTFDSDKRDSIAIRRLYVRHINAAGKTEVGVIPTYKGRVSSTGLSKDGWFQGLRHVYEARPGRQFELVAGALNTTNPERALSVADELNLFEFEYSATLNEQFSMELGLEHIENGNYLRGELRYHAADGQVWFGEFVRRADVAENKLVLGIDTRIQVQNYPINIFAYYAYVSTDFGPRAELTEDFLGTGQGGSVELSGDLALAKLDWFCRIDMVESTQRLLIGVKKSF